MTGWTVWCPICGWRVSPTDGSLIFEVAPRLAFHLWDAHPFEAAILRLFLNHPPAEWPVIDDVAA
jgi:hypothetical protein